MIVKNNPEEFISYLEDTSNIRGQAGSLVIPESQGELSQIIVERAQKGYPLTLSAGKTGTTGGCVPLEGDILSVERLDRIIDIGYDSGQEKWIARIEAGVSLSRLYEALQEHDLFYPPDPTEPLSLAAGTVSTCASGGPSFKYGSTRRWVKRLKIMLSSGDILDIPRGKYFFEARTFRGTVGNKQLNIKLPSYTMPSCKSSAGYFVKDDMDLIDLFIGQEGTLGLIMEADLEVRKREGDILSFVVFFKDEESCFSLIEILRKARTTEIDEPIVVFPDCLEFFDKRSLELLKTEFPSIPEASVCALFFEQRTVSEDKDDYISEYMDIFSDLNIDTERIWFSDTDKARKKIKDFRHSLPEIMNEKFVKLKIQKYSTDIAVPWKNFHRMLKVYREVLGVSNIEHVMFGHIGDGHLHVNIFPESRFQEETTRKMIPGFCSQAVKLGGTVSAEHGIGKIKKEYLKIMYTENDIKDMASLKRKLDAPCIFNPDNIFSKDYLVYE